MGVMDCCPHCGEESGYFTRRIATIEQHYEPDGTPFYGDIIRDHNKTTKPRCLDCGKLWIPASNQPV